MVQVKVKKKKKNQLTDKLTKKMQAYIEQEQVHFCVKDGK